MLDCVHPRWQCWQEWPQTSAPHLISALGPGLGHQHQPAPRPSQVILDKISKNIWWQLMEIASDGQKFMYEYFYSFKMFAKLLFKGYPSCLHLRPLRGGNSWSLLAALSPGPTQWLSANQRAGLCVITSWHFLHHLTHTLASHPITYQHLSIILYSVIA